MKSSFLAASLLLAPLVHGQADELDPTFGGIGYVVTDLPQTMAEITGAVTTQQDHKILVAGYDLDWMAPHLLLMRYMEDGSLDESFADGGVWMTPTVINTGLSAVIAGPGEAITVFGGDGSGNIYMARFTGDGVLDPSFGTGGELIINLGGQEGPSSAIRTVDGGLLVSGVRDSTGILLKLAFDGTIDQSFGQNGVAYSSITTTSTFNKVIRDWQGNYVACGVANVGSADYDVLVERFAQDGTHDPGFGSGGLVELPFDGLHTGANDVYAHPDGRIVVVGYAHTGSETDNNRTAIARLQSDGTLDPTFGTNGQRVLMVDDLNSIATDVFFRWDGMYIVVGWTMPLTEVYVRTWMTRLYPDGTTDSTFGANGDMLEDYGQEPPGAGIHPFVAMDPVGRVVTAATALSSDQGLFHMVVARYLKDPYTGLERQVLEADGIRAFPIPFQEGIHVDLPESFSGAVRWELRDALGALVMNGIRPAGSATDGGLYLGMPTSLAPGCYVLHVRCSGEERALRVMRD